MNTGVARQIATQITTAAMPILAVESCVDVVSTCDLFFHSDALTSQIIDNMLVGNDLNAIAN